MKDKWEIDKLIQSMGSKSRVRILNSKLEYLILKVFYRTFFKACFDLVTLLFTSKTVTIKDTNFG